MTRSGASQAARPPHPVGALPLCPPLSPEARQVSLDRTLAARPPGAAIQVFAYGSLLWQPDFRVQARQAGRLPGHRRSFCMWSTVGRGSPDYPGLGLALTPGGAGCEGLLYRLDETPESLEADLAALWTREMYAGVYEPHWLAVETETGSEPAIVFVVDRSHRQYAGEFDLEMRAQIIAHAAGTRGPCADYLTRTVEALAALDLADPELDALHEKVAAIRSLVGA